MCECLWEENSGKENERKDDQKAESSICGCGSSCGSSACAGDNFVLRMLSFYLWDKNHFPGGRSIPQIRRKGRSIQPVSGVSFRRYGYRFTRFYYQTRDEIFAATCQIYLENQYTREQYEAETERLRNLEFSYQDQTNMLYQDEENYCSVAYVAMANWIDRYEYAITLDDSNTIIYVYLQNMDAKDIHMQSDYLPKYFQDNNAGKHQDTDPMTSDYRSFYAFRIGDHYIDCMDLADQIEIADTEPETQAADVAQEVESN